MFKPGEDWQKKKETAKHKGSIQGMNEITTGDSSSYHPAPSVEDGKYREKRLTPKAEHHRQGNVIVFEEKVP
ncbi:hypothetical protein ZHAS_00019442 [Anopheles sinensis]|uniref:Uncharacterized protein n=1 Tax=Anopheles sinensis TaxID=74873 RepID=A0A084WLT8_ANOSI|nr:hypothetical protein ZHAS_00019442 [Anopheles sinensis]